jgi:peptide/nickel transport system permease protein
LPATLVVGSVVLILWLAVALTAPWVAPYDPLRQDMGNRLEPPSKSHPMGTDSLGRDTLSRLLYGARPTLGLVAFVAAAIVSTGLAVGIISGYCGGWIERALMALTNLVMAFPPLLLALAFMGLLGPGLTNAAVALMLTGWPPYARLARAEMQVLRRTDYIAAAEMQGITGIRLFWGHLLPFCIPAARIRLALDMARIILAAAALGFLGLGIRPPAPEWGMMIAEGSRVIFDQWWVAAFPGAAIFIVSLGCNLLADGLRDRDDPRYE